MDISELSVSNKSRLNQLHKTIFNSPLPSKLTKDNLKWISTKRSDIVKLIQTKYENNHTKVSYLATLKYITRLFKLDTAYNFYTPLFEDLHKQNDDLVNKNTLSIKQRSTFKPWEKILEMGRTIEDKTQLLLFHLYVDIPVRRLMDFQYMKYTANQNPEDTSFNYMIFKSKRPVKLIINRYKTAKVYGQYIYNIPKSMGEIWQLFTDFKEGELLFTLNGELIDQGKFSRLVKDTFEGLTLNDLRHIWISEFMKKRRSIEEVAIESTKMATSAEEFLRYNKIDL